MGLLDRITARRSELELRPDATVPADEPLFATKAFRKLLSTLASREAPILIDLGPVVGSNVSFFGEQVGCKIFVEDIYAELERHARAGKMEEFPAFLTRRFSQGDGTVDAVVCWDLIDYLDRPSAQALADQLTRVLRPEGALLGFFGTAQPRETQYTKFIIADDTNLKHRTYPATRGRQTILLNRDIIRLFSGLRVSDSFLMKNNIREILFRKPSYETR
jgi:methyltransferase family protein